MSDQLRKLVIVGSRPRNGDSIPLTPESQEIFAKNYGNPDDFWIDGFNSFHLEQNLPLRAAYPLPRFGSRVALPVPRVVR
jgi:hypothetical protein